MKIGILGGFLISFLVVFVVSKILLFPIKKILKLLLNSFIGVLILIAVNMIGMSFGFVIGINIVTSLVVGILGIPGVILLIILKIFF